MDPRSQTFSHGGILSKDWFSERLREEKRKGGCGNKGTGVAAQSLRRAYEREGCFNGKWSGEEEEDGRKRRKMKGKGEGREDLFLIAGFLTC